MRQPEYLSHSALQLWDKNREEFYLKYLAETKAPRLPQSPAMCVGSSFDAYVKVALCGALGISDPQFEFETLFESQVEPHNRDWGLKVGKYVMACYVECGAYGELLSHLEKSDRTPRFESTVKEEIEGVPLLGKPDCDFTRNEFEVILDWKVRGYCSKSTTSPTKWYRLCRDAHDQKPSRNHNQPHKQFRTLTSNPTYVELGVGDHYLEDCNATFAEQLTMYGWLLGAPVGDATTVLMLDEIVAKPNGTDYPLLRVANHCARTRPEFQQRLITRYQNMWDSIYFGDIFPDMNEERCRVAELTASELHQQVGFYADVVRDTTYKG